MIRKRIIGTILICLLAFNTFILCISVNAASDATAIPVLNRETTFKTHYDASEDLDGAQGKNGWSYKYVPVGQYRLDDYKELNHWNSTGKYWIWNTNTSGGVEEIMQYGRIRNLAGQIDQQSGNLGDSARVFAAPADGRIKITSKSGFIKEISSDDTSRFRIYKNTECIYPSDGSWLVMRKNDVIPFEDLIVDVNEGDQIIFRVNKGSDSISNSTQDSDGNTAGNGGDKVEYTPVIEYLPPEEPNVDISISSPRYFINENTEVFRLTDGTLSTHLDITNSGKTLSSVILFAVLYDNEGKIIKNVNLKNIGDIENGATCNTSIDIEVENASDSLLKIYIWENLKPLCKPIEFGYDEPGALTLYSEAPEAVESTAYSVTVNDREVFVEKFKDISYARFAFSGTANITVSVNENITSNNISPHSYNIVPSVNGKNMTFTLEESRKLIVNINTLEKLFIFADPLEESPPQLGDKDVYNVMDYTGVDNTGTTLNTQQIQNALNDVTSKPDGGVLYFPNGKYLTGTLHIKSNTTVYLQDGALIQGTTDIADYPNPLYMQDGTDANIGALLCFDQASNSKLTGRGVVSGGGRTLRENGRDAWLVSVMESRNIVVEDVILRDPSAFNSHICFSEYVTYQRVKMVNDISVPNTDGIDPDSSRHVVIDDVFSYCSDDSISVKTHRFTTLIQDTFDIVVKNCVFWTKKSALKIGDETFAYKMYDIHFINNDVVHADRAIVVYVSDGSAVSNVYWVNNRTEEIGGDTFERLIDMWIRTRAESSNTPGKIENLIIKDFYAEKFSKNNSYLEGLDQDYQIKNIYIDNFVVGGQKTNTLSEAKISMNSYVQNVVFGQAPELSLPQLPSSFDGGTFIERDGMVVFEAEHYDSIQAKDNFEWVLNTQKHGALGEGTMTSNFTSGSSFTNTNRGPQINYKVKFSTPGTYYVWARMYAPSGVGDKIYFGLNGSTPASTDAIRGNANQYGWYWSNIYQNGGYAKIIITEPGVHTINVYMGGKKLYFDKMFLWNTSNGTDVPKYMTPSFKGLGPVESETENENN